MLKSILISLLITLLISALVIDPVYANSDIKKLSTVIPYDKQLHFTWGFVLTVTLIAITNSFSIGIFTVILLELYKEYFIDDFPDIEDFIYTFFGVIFGCSIADILVRR